MGFFKKVSSSGADATGNNKQRQNIPSLKKFSSASRKKDAPASGGQKKRASNSLTKFSAPKKTRRKEIADEEISSDDDDEEFHQDDIGSKGSEDEYEDECIAESTADDKQLLKTIKDDLSDESDDDSIGQIEKPAPVVHRKIAHSTKFFNYEQKTEKLLSYRLHRLTPVCVSFSSDGRYVVSCSKDGSIAKFDLDCRRACKILKLAKNDEGSNCHTGHVLCCAISPDDRYLATAGNDKLIKIWGFHTLEFIQEFKAHRSAITSLVFRKTLAPIELYSGSSDRSVKAWNLDQMGFVDTMYGHQDAIQQMDMLSRARVLTCGGQDRTLRLFKVAEESQLVFNGFADAISIDTGSSNGVVRLWKVGDDYKSLKVGFVNSIRFTDDARMLACAVGQEHRGGRWWKIQEAKNSIVVIPLLS